MKRLLLHTCCAPCLTIAAQRLTPEYEFDVFFFNPNIFPAQEYEKRLAEVIRYAEIIGRKVINYQNQDIYRDQWNIKTKPFAEEPEGGIRCAQCFITRLEETANFAKEYEYEFFSTTLTTSPHKNAEVINQVGNNLSELNEITYLESNFKKQNGYLISKEICREYDIYRQSYCGCIYSVR